MKQNEVVETLQSLKRDMTFMLATRITAINHAIKCVELVPQLAEILLKIMLNAKTRHTGVGMQCVHRLMFDMSDESFNEITELLEKSTGGMR
jgi:hypothetical protein